MQSMEMNKRRLLEAVLVIFGLIVFVNYFFNEADLFKTVTLTDLYYLPVVIAAIGFGWVWGLITAIASGVAIIIQLIPFHDTDTPFLIAVTFGVMVRLFLFIFIGISAGVLSDAERKRKAVVQKLNLELERANQKLQQRVLELTTLYETARHLSATLDINLVMSNVLDTAIKSLNGNAGFLYLFDPEKNEYMIRAARGNIHNTPRQVTFQTGEEMLAVVARTQKGVLVADIETTDQFTLEFDNPEQVDIRSMLCVPLLARNQVIGMISLTNSKQIQPWDLNNLNLVTMLAAEAAIAVDNSMMYQRVNSAYIEIIGNLVSSIEPRDVTAVVHSSRTMGLVSELAVRLGLDEMDTNAVRYVVLIHNLGKVGIDTKLTMRTDIFLNEVRKSLRNIASSDQTALASIRFLERVNPIVKYQHEWFNGTGVPEGKKGEAIPLGSRIVSVIDTFHMLVHPSGAEAVPSLSNTQAIEQIQYRSGSQFDPAVVAAFIKIVESLPRDGPDK
jgi:response regulator RpfG family c-di-GMP phosphodiesterase